MRAYFVMDRQDDWGVMVVANTAQKAKPLGHKAIADIIGDTPLYTDMRATLCKTVVVPESITEPQVFVDCSGNEDWMCSAYGYGEGCEDCDRAKQKRIEAYGEDEVTADEN